MSHFRKECGAHDEGIDRGGSIHDGIHGGGSKRVKVVGMDWRIHVVLPRCIQLVSLCWGSLSRRQRVCCSAFLHPDTVFQPFILIPCVLIVFPHLPHKETFFSNIDVKSIYLHDTRRDLPDQVMEGGRGWVMQGVLSRASFVDHQSVAK